MTTQADTDSATANTALQSPSSDTGRGIAMMTLAVGLYSIMDAMVKWLGPDYPVLELVFFRSLFAFVPIAYVLWRNGSFAGLRTTRPWGHAARSLAGLISISLFFYAYTRMPLANVVAISFAAPLLVTALSVPLLGERVGWRRWSAVVVGFLGVTVTDLRQLEPINITNASGPVVFHMFAAWQWLGGEPSMQGDEHSELRWFTVEEACRLDALALDEYRVSFRSLARIGR